MIKLLSGCVKQGFSLRLSGRECARLSFGEGKTTGCTGKTLLLTARRPAFRHWFR
jgi:hypothetical protein